MAIAWLKMAIVRLVAILPVAIARDRSFITEPAISTSAANNVAAINAENTDVALQSMAAQLASVSTGTTPKIFAVMISYLPFFLPAFAPALLQ